MTKNLPVKAASPAPTDVDVYWEIGLTIAACCSVE